jgi:hypothetical protein
MLIVLNTAVLSLTPLTPVRPTLLLSGGAPPPPPQEVSVNVILASIYISDLINLQFHMLDSHVLAFNCMTNEESRAYQKVHPSVYRPSWSFKTRRFPSSLAIGDCILETVHSSELPDNTMRAQSPIYPAR